MELLVKLAPEVICVAFILATVTMVSCFLRRRGISLCQHMSFFMTSVSSLGLWQEKASGRIHGTDTIVIGMIGVLLLILYLRNGSPVTT